MARINDRNEYVKDTVIEGVSYLLGVDQPTGKTVTINIEDLANFITTRLQDLNYIGQPAIPPTADDYKPLGTITTDINTGGVYRVGNTLVLDISTTFNAVGSGGLDTITIDVDGTIISTNPTVNAYNLLIDSEVTVIKATWNYLEGDVNGLTVPAGTITETITINAIDVQDIEAYIASPTVATESIPVILDEGLSLGAYENGDTIELNQTQSLNDVIKLLAQEYVSSTFTSLDLTTSTTTPIVGQPVTISDVTINYTNSSDGQPPQNVLLNVGNLVGVPIDLSVSNFYDVNPDEVLSFTNAGEVTIASVSGDNTQAASLDGIEVKITWTHEFLFGASDVDLVDQTDADIIFLSLTKYRNNSKEQEVTTTVDSQLNTHKTFIAYPSVYGNLSNIIQNDSSSVLGAFTKVSNYNFTNLQGVTTDYAVYVSNATGAFAVGTNLKIS